jgi:hypothetical protein
MESGFTAFALQRLSHYSDGFVNSAAQRPTVDFQNSLRDDPAGNVMDL